MNGDWVSGPRDADGRGTRRATAAISTRTVSRASSTPMTTGSRACRTGRRSRCRCSRRRTGAARACIRAAISRASCAPASNQKWLEVPRHRALDAFLHGLWRRPAEEVLRPFPQGRGDRLGQAAEGAAAGASSGDKFVERHEKEWPLARTQWTKFYPPPGGFTLSTERQAKRSSVTYTGLATA